MQGSTFNEEEFFLAVARSKARALLIGRRALIAIGIPVMTSDYDFWVHPDDVALFNEALKPLDLRPTLSPEAARASGRYVLENDEHVDVLVARVVSTIEGVRVSFDDIWSRRVFLPIQGEDKLMVPSIDDLILTKRFAGRPKDAEDIRLLEILRKKESKK